MVALWHFIHIWLAVDWIAVPDDIRPVRTIPRYHVSIVTMAMTTETESYRLFCPTVWDQLLCWPPTIPGETAQQLCPPLKGIDRTRTYSMASFLLFFLFSYFYKSCPTRFKKTDSTISRPVDISLAVLVVVVVRTKQARKCLIHCPAK